MSAIDRFTRRIGIRFPLPAASLLDIFGTSRFRLKRGSLEDDWRAIGEDFAAVGRDMHKVIGLQSGSRGGERTRPAGCG